MTMKLGTAYQPQTKNLVEMTNEVSEGALRHFVIVDHRHRDELFPLIDFAMKASYQFSKNATPFKSSCSGQGIVSSFHKFGRNSRRLTRWGAISKTRSRVFAPPCNHTNGISRPGAVHMAKDKTIASSHTKRNSPHFSEDGIQVWFNPSNVKIRHISLRHKLVPRYIELNLNLETVGCGAVRLELLACNPLGSPDRMDSVGHALP